MAEVVLFHHVLGLTAGMHAFADDLRAAGHTVHTPDVFQGSTFASIDEGMAFVQEQGFPELIERAAASADDLPSEVAYIGFSFGVVGAQMLTQTKPGARAGIFCYSCIPADEFGAWPEGVPAQIHAMDRDPFFVDEEDVHAANALVSSVSDAELFLYAGSDHYFADKTLPTYDPVAAELLMSRVLTLLARV